MGGYGNYDPYSWASYLDAGTSTQITADQIAS
jgi:hypothetical protein